MILYNVLLICPQNILVSSDHLKNRYQNKSECKSNILQKYMWQEKKKKGIQREQESCGNALPSGEMAVKSLAKGLNPQCSSREILLETSAYIWYKISW